jgi:hypothetical protein
MFGRHIFKTARLRPISRKQFGLSKTKRKEFEITKATEKNVTETRRALIAPGSDQHNDLPSFLNYASRHNLSATAPVYIGTHYEYIVASSLPSLGFTLTRTGRQSDYGIDLLGHWQIPSLPAPVRVLLQCKAHSKPLTPANVRELEGAFNGAPPAFRGGGVFGFLAATTQATKGMRDALIRSSYPMGFVQVTDEGKILQFVWNHVATQSGLEGMGATARFTPLRDGTGVEEEIALTWKGWSISKEQTAEVVTVEPVAKITNTKPKAEIETEVKKRGRPRKVEQPEVEKRGRPRKTVELKAASNRTLAKAKAPKKAESKVKAKKAQPGLKTTSKGQKKKS